MAWSSIELHNFRHYVKTTPKHLLGKAPPDNPTHAYDAKHGALDHGFSRPIRRQDFSRNGIFDYSRRGMALDEETTATKRGDPIKLLFILGKSFSPADWADLGVWLKEYKFEDGAADDLNLPERREDFRPKNRVEAAMDSAQSKRAREDLYERIPELARIGLGTGDRLQDIDPRRVLNQTTPVAMDSNDRQRVVEGIEKFAPGFAAVKLGPL